MKVLTKELKEKIEKHLEEVDLFEEDLVEPRKILKESLGKRLSEWDYDILSNVIDNEELHKEINEIKEKEEKGNIFD